MSVTFGSGETRRCDEKCYNAISPECDCICHGMNHGKGLKQAQENTALYVKELVKEYGKGIILNPEQMELF